jgi:thioredoxin reductase/Pyruvate/2-oxoacid:ferredoxin oxidoreductase delta subunit
LSWVLLAALIAVLAFALWARRRELTAMAHGRSERTKALELGSHKARLHYPHVDLSRCMGCGLCAEACPEEGVLEILHGQAVVVHGARCVGHGRCAEACPVGAIALTLADVAERRDLPAVSETLESVTTPGLFLAGEVTGHALVRTAIGHGTAVAAEVARRSAAQRAAPDVRDLVIVGAGPAGLACSLEARRRGLDFVTLEREELGGTVSKYPRRKLVMTQPVELPLFGRLARSEYTKEELMETWQRAARQHELPIRTGEEFQGLVQQADGSFEVRSSGGSVRARHVCIAIGRRGTPRKLEVPGEELAKVSYGLMDAASYVGRRILVVGGGDSAVEAALGLSEQEGNQVLVSYRKGGFFRLKARNQKHLDAALEAGRLEVLFNSRVTAVREGAVDLALEVAGGEKALTLDNDDVFIFAGGVAPFELLERSGVSFDPSLRPAPEPLAEEGTGLVPALGAALLTALVACVWTLWMSEYYALEPHARASSPLHGLLRPGGPVGFALGVAAVTAMAANLLYLVRRRERLGLKLGSLKRWMTAHVASGVLALLFALVHGGMAPGDTVGGHALLGLVVLVTTGAIGRYLYAFVPRAANGRELELDEVQARLAALASEWEREGGGFGERVREAVSELATRTAWRASLGRRIVALIGSQRALRRTLDELRAEGTAAGVAPEVLREMLELARRAHRAALASAHYEEVRAVLASWRWIHRWVALLVVLLVARHVVSALKYGSILGGGG